MPSPMGAASVTSRRLRTNIQPKRLRDTVHPVASAVSVSPSPPLTCTHNSTLFGNKVSPWSFLPSPPEETSWINTNRIRLLTDHCAR